MKELDSEKLKSAFALINLEYESQLEVEHTAKFTPAVIAKKVMANGENIPVIFMETAAVG